MNNIKYLTIGKGSSRVVRIFARLGSNNVHWVNDDKGRFRRTFCSGIDCKTCSEDNRSQTRWTLGVIDKEDGEAKLFEVGAQIMSKIVEFVTGSNPTHIFSSPTLRKHPRQMDNYDIVIHNKGVFGGYDVTFYKARPLKKSETNKAIELLAGLAERSLHIT